MRIIQASFKGDENIGLYGLVTDNYFICGTRVKQHSFKIKPRKMSIMETPYVGIFLAGNSQGLIAPSIIEEEELEKLKNVSNVLVLDTNYTALGNLVLINDKGIIISKYLKKEKEKLQKFFGIPVLTEKIGTSNLVGSVAYTTNKGCLVNPKTKKAQRDAIKKVLKVDIDIGTVSFGSPFISAGMLANKHGVMISDRTGGPETQRITEVFGFVR